METHSYEYLRIAKQSPVCCWASTLVRLALISGLEEVNLEADEYYFEPAFLRGTPGQKLKLEIENESSTLHSFTIPEQSLDMDIPPQGKVVVEVTFPPSGVVRFFCRFHSELGMDGELLTGDAKPQAASGNGDSKHSTKEGWFR